MWELDYKESWVPKNWCFWTVVLEKTLENLLDSKEFQPVHPKGIQSWIFTGRTDAKTETPILWPPDVKNWLIGKDPDAWERLRAGGEGDNRGWDGWMASPTQWTWAWVNSGSWWWTGRSGVLQSMGSHGVRWLSDWTELGLLCFSGFLWLWRGGLLFTAVLRLLIAVTSLAVEVSLIVKHGLQSSGFSRCDTRA